MLMPKFKSKTELEEAIKEKTIWNVMKNYQCSRNTVINYLKKFNIETPKGFYNTGGTVGCPKGTKRTQSQIKQMSDRMIGNSNPFFGKKHTLETRKQMSLNHADFNGHNNPFKKALIDNPHKREELRERTKIRWKNRTDCERNMIKTKLSLAMSKSEYHRKNTSYKKHQHGFYQSTKSGTVFYRSSWELKTIKELDDSTLVKHFIVEPFNIIYKDKNNQDRYSRPDLLITLLSGEQILVEIKPKTMMLLNNNKEKIIGYKIFCKERHIQFSILDNETNLDYLLKSVLKGEMYVTTLD